MNRKSLRSQIIALKPLNSEAQIDKLVNLLTERNCQIDCYLDKWICRLIDKFSLVLYYKKKSRTLKYIEPDSDAMSYLAELLVKHEIPSADRSQANPFLFAFIIPMTCQKSRVKAFANDLFHALHVLPEEESMDVAQANHYCAFDADREKGCYLVIFNHPAIFDYSEDSPEGRCAYGEWKS